jgi:hypothetical protein
MTKVRLIGTHHEAIDRVAGLIGYANAAHHITKSESYIRQCGDPDCAREIHAVEAACLDQVCKAEYGETPFADWLNRKNIEVTWTGPRIDLRDAANDLTVAQGKLCEAIRAAKAPTEPGGKRITEAERQTVLRAIRDQRGSLDAMENELTAQADTNNVIGITA